MNRKKKLRLSEADSATSPIQTQNFIAPDKWIYAGLGAVYLLLVLWGLLSEGTWDDDCVGRFFRVKNAFNDPSMFIDLWVRPLFALVYAIPLQLGKEAVVFESALITVATCYFIYRSARLMDRPNAFMVIPLLAFQAFYFPVSFSALTEPLAALILAAGLFLHLKRRYLVFALVGGLLPLARLELAPLLLFWAVILLRRQHYGYIALLALPTIGWNFAGALWSGDPIWLLHQVFTGDSNRYGHGSFWQYPQRYIFFIGPAVFYLFMLGLQERLFKRKFDFALIQFLAGFSIYILFSWKLNIGHAAGFIRNIYPLSPFAALLALEGFNSQFVTCLTKARFKRQLAYMAITVALTLLFLSRKLVIHHIVTNEPDFINIAVMAPFIILFILSSYLFPKFYTSKYMLKLSATLVIGITMSYTLITEPPITLIPERQVMQNVAKWYQDNDLEGLETYINHTWFFYSEDMDYFADNIHRTTVENLEAAPEKSIIIWESHYAHRLSGNVPYDYFKDKPYKILAQAQTPDRRFVVVIYQKTR
ncbi:MAG: hypothetical protein IID15_04000 [Candidatus Marinimicrobia bacterium]|nr:hypothetical protein [Candidatus Neomarinimicrobiota bacterium]